LPDDMIRLEDVGWTMTDASLCGLGQTAASAVLSAMKLWPELFGRDEMKEEKAKQIEKVPKVSKVSKVSTALKKPVAKKAGPKAVKKVTKSKATKAKSKKTSTREK